MKHRSLALGLIVLAIIAFRTSHAGAQTTANGPYYATPSWDQQLPASTRFTVLSNWESAAVLDRETGLVWERSPSTSAFIWWSAQEHCNELALGNRMGWRLPTLQELASLFDPTRIIPSLPSGHPFTIVLSASRFWSANTLRTFTDTNGPSGAWFVDFVFGVANGDRVLEFSAWCVRGGQGVDPQ